MSRMELGPRGKFLVFLAVVTLFAWPGYQAFLVVAVPVGSSSPTQAAAEKVTRGDPSPTRVQPTLEPPARFATEPTPAATMALSSQTPTNDSSRRATLAPVVPQTPSSTSVPTFTSVPTATSVPTSTSVPAATSVPTPGHPTATPQVKFPGGSPLEIALIEDWVIRLTNEEREKAGLRLFDHDPAISSIAGMHSEQMVLFGLSHTILGKDPTDRALEAGYNCRAYHGDGSYSYGLSENIAEHPRVKHWVGTSSGWSGYRWKPTAYYTDAKDAARSLVQGWMNSPGHRANILDRDSRRIGVGVAVELSDKHGWALETLYATQNFSSCR